MSAAKAALPLLALALAAVGLAGSPLAGLTPLELATLVGGAVAVVLLWALTLARRRWARLLLMCVCTYEAVTQLVGLSDPGRPNLLVLATSAVAVLVLIAVSSTQARRWVERST